MENFVYSLEHINFEEIKNELDLLSLLEKHDEESFKYCVNTGLLNIAILKEIGETDKEKIYKFFKCGIFHDIGKLGMKKDFINYPGPFPLRMYQEMKKHTLGGGELLEKVNAEEEMINTAKYHHCNYDGSGYPGGIYGKEIPLEARVTRISDSIDAYMSKRCYKEGGPANQVTEDLLQYKNKSYDPDLLEGFVKAHEKIMDLCHRDGHDHPSQEIYMLFLENIYGTEEKERFKKNR